MGHQVAKPPTKNRSCACRWKLVCSSWWSFGVMRLLESVHLYRKVPRDLTDATCLGGLMSIGCALMMAFLFVSNTSEYMSVAVSTDVELRVRWMRFPDIGKSDSVSSVG